MSKSLVTCFLMVITVLSSVGAAAGAAPQGPWQPATRLSDPGITSVSPQLAIALDGRTTAVWARSNGPLQTTTRPPGGSFGVPVDLVGSGPEAGSPRLAISPDGTETVVWRRATDSNSVVVSAATRPPGGSFGVPVDISAPTSRNPNGGDSLDGLNVVAAGEGTVTAIWLRKDGSSAPAVQAATRPPGGSFGAPVNLSTAGMVSYPEIAGASDGTTTVVWSRRDNLPDALTVVQAATRPPGGGFGTPVDISAPTGEVLGSPSIAAAKDGTATVVWSRKDFDGSGDPPSAIQAATRPPGGSFGAAVELPGSRPAGGVPKIAISPDGTATVVWRWNSANSSADTIKAATRPPRGSFGAAVDIPSVGAYFWISLVAAADDGTVTVVSGRVDGPDAVTATTRPPGGSFGPQVDVSGYETGSNAAPVQLAVGPDGAATVVWQRTNVGKPFEPRIQTASTQAPKFTLGVEKDGSGEGLVTTNPGGINCGIDCSEDFTSYSQVTLNALPANGSSFTGWSGAGCSGTGNCEVSVGSNVQATATFTADAVVPPLAAKIGNVSISGSATVKKGKTVNYKARISNSGSTEATGVRLKVSGRGVSFNTSVGTVAAGATRSVKVRLKPRKPGKIKATFKVTSDNAGGKTVKKTITVKK